MKVTDLPLFQRPRERLFQYGPEALSNIELLAVILSNGSNNLSVLRIAEKLAGFGLIRLSRMSADELLKVKGIGVAKAAKIVACFELASRVNNERAYSCKINCPEDVVEFFGSQFRKLDKECFFALLLNNARKMISIERISVGSMDLAIAHPREVFRKAIEKSAAGLILIHNHPSGDETPSKEDISLTKRMVKAGEIIGIKVVDHVIIGDGYFSFKEAGLLEP